MEDTNELDASMDLEVDDIVGSFDEEPALTRSEIRARKDKLLIKAHSAILKASWGQSSRSQKSMKAIWSFFVKSTDADAKEAIDRIGKSRPGRAVGEGGKQVGEAVTCFYCYSWDHEELHPSIDVEHPCLIDSGLFGDENIAEWLPEEALDNARRATSSSTFLYKSSSSQLLRQHVLRHHPHELRIIEAGMFPNGIGSSSGGTHVEDSSIASGSDRRPTQVDIRAQFKSAKKKSVDDRKQVMFNKLVSLLVVFAYLPFHFVENVWF